MKKRKVTKAKQAGSLLRKKATINVPAVRTMRSFDIAEVTSGDASIELTHVTASDFGRGGVPVDLPIKFFGKVKWEKGAWTDKEIADANKATELFDSVMLQFVSQKKENVRLSLQMGYALAIMFDLQIWRHYRDAKNALYAEGIPGAKAFFKAFLPGYLWTRIVDMRDGAYTAIRFKHTGVLFTGELEARRIRDYGSEIARKALTDSLASDTKLSVAGRDAVISEAQDEIVKDGFKIATERAQAIVRGKGKNANESDADFEKRIASARPTSDALALAAKEASVNILTSRYGIDREKLGTYFQELPKGVQADDKTGVGKRKMGATDTTKSDTPDEPTAPKHKRVEAWVLAFTAVERFQKFANRFNTTYGPKLKDGKTPSGQPPEDFAHVPYGVLNSTHGKAQGDGMLQFATTVRDAMADLIASLDHYRSVKGVEVAVHTLASNAPKDESIPANPLVTGGATERENARTDANGASK